MPFTVFQNCLLKKILKLKLITIEIGLKIRIICVMPRKNFGKLIFKCDFKKLTILEIDDRFYGQPLKTRRLRNVP